MERSRRIPLLKQLSLIGAVLTGCSVPNVSTIPTNIRQIEAGEQAYVQNYSPLVSNGSTDHLINAESGVRPPRIRIVPFEPVQCNTLPPDTYTISNEIIALPTPQLSRPPLPDRSCVPNIAIIPQRYGSIIIGEKPFIVSIPREDQEVPTEGWTIQYTIVSEQSDEPKKPIVPHIDPKSFLLTNYVNNSLVREDVKIATVILPPGFESDPVTKAMLVWMAPNDDAVANSPQQ